MQQRPDDLQAGFHRQSRHELGVRSLPAAFVYPVVLLVLAATTNFFQDHPYFLGAALALSLAAAHTRAFSAHRLSRNNLHPAAADRLFLLFQIAVYLTCFVWGVFSAGAVIYYVPHRWEGALTLLSVAALAAGVTNSLAPDRALAWRALALLLSPPIAACFLERTWEHAGLAVCGLLYGVYLAVQTHQHWELYRKAWTAIEAAEARERAEVAAKTKSEMMASLSHEIRNPLNGLIGTLDLLAQSDLNPQQREHVSVSQIATSGLLNVLNSVLDFSTFEDAVNRPADIEFELDCVLESAISTYRLSAVRKGLAFSSSVQFSARGRYRGDPVRLGQVITNLVANAFKFTRQGSIHVSVEAPPGPSPTRVLKFAVRDTGPGISSLVRQHLFERFMPHDESGGKPKGTGLGLAISKQIVVAMGGEIGVESAPGEGSTFWFSVPLTRTGRAPPDSASSAPRILVAEDNPVNRRLLQRMIEAFGHQVEIVENGRQAVEAAAHSNYNIILMDCQMPEMDGYTAARTIRSLPSGSHRAAIIATSGSTIPEDREKAVQSGMDAFLIKPFTREQLASAITHASAPLRDRPL
ncbi:MAG: response regulator [Bryobacterales bacterium]|nr:response regulator [Bryobacterales bacterium]